MKDVVDAVHVSDLLVSRSKWKILSRYRDYGNISRENFVAFDT